jgi:hypothetical protein
MTFGQDPAGFIASEVVRRFYFRTVRFGAHVPRAAVVAIVVCELFEADLIKQTHPRMLSIVPTLFGADGTSKL